MIRQNDHKIEILEQSVIDVPKSTLMCLAKSLWS